MVTGDDEDVFADFAAPGPEAAFADFTPPPPPMLEPKGPINSFGELAERKRVERKYKAERYPVKPPPLLASRSDRTNVGPVAAPPKHASPPVEELRDLIRLYQRRRDEIAQDQSLAYDASLQALSIVVHAYEARYRCATAEAAAVLRPLTIGAMG